MCDPFENNIAVSIKNLRFSYKATDGTEVPIFKDINLSLRARQIIGIVGRNGSGKTTLLNLIRGMACPDAGIISVFSSTIVQDGTLRSKPSATLITQKPDASLGPSMTVFENYIFAKYGNNPSLRWAFRRKEKESCRNLISEAGIGLELKLDEQVRFLSGGQQQVLSVLFGLSSCNRLLLMDEPTASLDPISADCVLNLAVNYCRTWQGLVMIVSHKINELLPRCDALIVIGHGQAKYIDRQSTEWAVDAIHHLY